jgi:hypothetical protein
MNTREDIGLDRERPYLEGSPLTIKVPVYVSGLGEPAQIQGFTARWTLRAAVGFGYGDAIMTKTTDDNILNNGAEFLVVIEQGETTGNRHMHRHELWINNGNAEFPVLYGDFYITPSPMAPGQTV